MKFNVSSKTLYTFVSAVSKVINSKNALTILNNFLFELSGDTLTVTASDLENTLVAHMEVMDAEGEGRFCVDARRLVDLLKEMPDQGLEFNINDQNLSVELTYATGNYSFIALNGSEYPSNEADAEASDANFSFVCPTEQVLKGIDNTLFAVGNDDLRPQMMGILWDIKPDGIVFVSTDTRKLVRYRNNMSEPGQEGSFILPVKRGNQECVCQGRGYQNYGRAQERYFRKPLISLQLPIYQRQLPRLQPSDTSEQSLCCHSRPPAVPYRHTPCGCIR